MKIKTIVSVLIFSLLLLGCSDGDNTYQASYNIPSINNSNSPTTPSTNPIYTSDPAPTYSTTNPPVVEKTTISYEKLSGSESFKPSSNSSFEVIFFDIYNAVSSDGKSYEHLCDNPTTANKPSDCYLIKSGDVEILVDGGFFGPSQTSANSKTKYQIMEKSILPKIASYLSDDGVLDYLIVTHSDFDHISMLSGFNYNDKSYGIFDAFLENREIQTFDNSSKQIKKFNCIKNIIDFDGYKTRCLCDEDNTNKLVDTDTFRDYRSKRDQLEKNENTYYSAASTFFEEANCAQMDNDDDYQNEDGQLFPSHLSNYVPTFYQEENAATAINVKHAYPKEGFHSKVANGDKWVKKYKENTVSNKPYKEKEFGKLVSHGECVTREGKTIPSNYTYDINLGDGVTLSILYNWFYDHYYQHSFSSPDCNDLSVCFEVFNSNEKILITGDATGDTEDALLRYYPSTTGVLNNVTCYKSAHHGSTTYRHGSSGYRSNCLQLFDTIFERKGIVVTTGVFQKPRALFVSENKVTDHLYQALSGVAQMNQDFFDSANKYADYILCPEAVVSVSERPSDFTTTPLYGDIHIKFNKGKTLFSFNYTEDTLMYIEGSEQLSNYAVSKVDGNKAISLQNTNAYKAMGLI